ncbi:MAG TPA: TMEM175 family protein [Pseudonocardia sp.]
MADRERDLERLLTFVDAVVAIAITLLVLPLAEVGSQVNGRSVAELLAMHQTDIFGFLLSFVVIARLWVAQHYIVRSLVRQSPLLIWLLLAWSLTIVFLPFPTTLVAGTAHDSLATLLYLGTMALSSLLLALMAYVIGRDRGLRDSEDKPDPRQATGTAIGFLLALVVSVAIPAAGYWPLLLLLLVDPIVRRLPRTPGR